MTSIVVLVQHDGLGVIIPKCPTNVLQLGHPPPPLPPFCKVVVYLSGSHLLTRVLSQCLSYLVNVLFFEALVCPSTRKDELLIGPNMARGG